MHLSDDLFLMKSFPDFHEQCFNICEYNKTFEKKNVIIHASAKNVAYAEHWGPLSVKCTIRGAEHYQCSSRFYSIDKNQYLIFNEGQYYSSYIYSDVETESFTINFSNSLRQDVVGSFEENLNEKQNKNYEFIEKLYQHNDNVTPLIIKLYKATLLKNPDVHLITELYFLLLEKLLLQQMELRDEIKKIKAVKYSTKVELYKRLNYAKDFIQSCYMNDIDLETLASVACMNKAYFLREFKKYFGVTPYQYIITQRLKAAKQMLATTSGTITEICFATGYRDISSFCKLFKKNFCLTPEQYQRNCMKKSFFTC
jgi:AraC-like DNA-binding protein